MGKKKKVRVELRKNRNDRPRDKAWADDETAAASERVRAKGEHSRKRTVVQDEGEASAMPAAQDAQPGRVLRVHRDVCVVQDEAGREVRCAVRWLLRSLSTHERAIVTTGDRVWFQPAEGDSLGGVVVRVEPRHGMLTRASRGREHVLVANVDQVVFVVSLVEPDLKVHLVDRFLASAQKGGIRPVLCLNKADRVELTDYQPMIGTYSQLGVETLLTSAVSGLGVDALREKLAGRQTVFSGQSGVGKSSLLNAVEPELGLRVREVSDATSKGRHTTTSADLIRLSFGGWVVDTPGIRQFALFDVAPEETEAYFPEFRPFISKCGFRDCTHTDEEDCGVKRAVHRRQISALRYTSYVGMFRDMGITRERR
ncbi:MAG: ribosome small subunit-dependent GTPase A [Gemmataceae bacterium]|nr:ribosome small subunit-dependent GTPase A [Gemmataceae bacterium]